MILTLAINDYPVYVNTDLIAFMTEEDYVDKKKGKVHFTRIYLKAIKLPEDVPNWVDVKESVKSIVKQM